MRRLQEQTSFYTGANLQVFVINIVRIVDNCFLLVASTIGKIISDKPLDNCTRHSNAPSFDKVETAKPKVCKNVCKHATERARM